MRRRIHPLPLWMALFVAALLPVVLLRDYTPSNELRYLSIADEALREGHLFAFTFHGAPYADKPPLYLWIVMLGRRLLGSHHMGFLALFSLVPALLILRTMDRWVRPTVGERTRTTAALMLMSSGLYLGLAVVLRMDMLMCLFIVLALRTFWRMYTGAAGKGDRILFPAWVFLALFTKGPVGLLVPLAATCVYLLVRGQGRQLGRYWGWTTWGVLAGGCALWFAAVWLESGGAYLHNLLFHQTIDRAVDAFHHKEPFYFYLVSMWYSLAPWSPLAIGTIVAAFVRRERPGDSAAFFLTVILTTLAMLSAFSSKLAVYLAPAFPFFIYTAVLLRPRLRKNGWTAAAVALPVLVWTAALPAAIVLARAPQTDFLNNGACLCAAGVLTATGIAAGVLLVRRPTLHLPIDTLAAGLFVALFVGGFALPRLNARIGYGALCAQARTLAAQEGAADYYVWKIRRAEGMDVYLGRDAVQVTAEEILSGGCAGGVLMLREGSLGRDEALQRYLSGRERRSVGPYLLLHIPPPADPHTKETPR